MPTQWHLAYDLLTHWQTRARAAPPAREREQSRLGEAQRHPYHVPHPPSASWSTVNRRFHQVQDRGGEGRGGEWWARNPVNEQVGASHLRNWRARYRCILTASMLEGAAASTADVGAAAVASLTHDKSVRPQYRCCMRRPTRSSNRWQENSFMGLRQVGSKASSRFESSRHVSNDDKKTIDVILVGMTYYYF